MSLGTKTFAFDPCGENVERWSPEIKIKKILMGFEIFWFTVLPNFHLLNATLNFNFRLRRKNKFRMTG